MSFIIYNTYLNQKLLFQCSFQYLFHQFCIRQFYKTKIYDPYQKHEIKGIKELDYLIKGIYIPFCKQFQIKHAFYFEKQNRRVFYFVQEMSPKQHQRQTKLSRERLSQTTKSNFAQNLTYKQENYSFLPLLYSDGIDTKIRYIVTNFIISFYMDSISTFVQGYNAIFQQCLLAKDPIAHLNSLTDSVEKKILLFLLQPHSQSYKEELKSKYSIKGELLDNIDKWKMQAKICNANNPEEIKYIIEQFIKDNTSAFNYPKPADFQTATDQGKPQESTLPSKLKPIPSLQEWAKEQLDKKQDNIANFSVRATQALGKDKLMKLKLANKERVLNMPKLFRDYPDEFVTDFVKTFYQQMLKQNKNYEIPSHIFLNLTKSQFVKLKDVIENLVNKDQYLRVWFSYNFEEELQKYQSQDLTFSEKDQKRKVILKILKDLNELKTAKTKQIQRSILRQLLLLDISRQDVDKALFLQYLQDNTRTSSYDRANVREKKYKKNKANNYNNNQHMDIMVNVQSSSSSSSQDKLIKECIEGLFKKGDAEKTLKQLEEYFETAKLNKLFAISKLSEGGKIDDYSNYLPLNELKQFKETRQITILDSNKKKWKAQDQIQLKIRVKNISNIHVKIYKLDLEKHYIEGNYEINQTQDLSYLQPNHSYDYTVQNSNPYLIQIFDMKIEGIPQHRGAWIIDLEGEGISSRAFIRKGAIAIINSINTAGTQLKFYDENGTQIKDYKIWLDGKKLSVESSFIIPFGEIDKNLNIIVTKEGYSQRFDVYVPAQSYYLSIDYIYSAESFIVGSIAKVLLHPHLNLSYDRNIDVSFKLLQKTKILVTLTNNLGIKSTIDFDNIQFKSNEDYLLEFPIQSYIKNIDISVSAKIKKYNKKQETLTNDHSIVLNLCQNNTNLIDLYLRKNNKQYILYILGKNGQPIPRTEITIQYYADGRSNKEIQTLISQKDGSVNLGELHGVSLIYGRVNLKTGSVMRGWTLENKNNEVDLVTNPIFREKQEITFLVPSKQNIYLWRVSGSGTYLENLSNRLTFEAQQIRIKDLEVGKYILSITESERRIDFEVVGGKNWQNENKIFDEKKGFLYELDPDQNHHVCLGEATFNKEGDNLVINIPVKGTYDFAKDPSLRGHIIVSNFVLPNFSGQFYPSSLRGLREVKTQAFSTKASEYYNNKKLSEEMSYSINRRREKKYIGNNLQKPRVFLKRIQVRDTTQTDEVLQGQGDYASKQFEAGGERERMHTMAQRCAPYTKMSGKVHGSLSSGPVPIFSPEDVTSHNNFLALPGTIVSNQKGDTLVFRVPYGYSHFECLLFSKKSGISRKYDYTIEDIGKKNLTHNGILQGTKDTAWTMSREVYKAKKGENIKVGRDSVWSAIGISNVVGFAKIKGVTLEDWVINWNTYSFEEKIKTYDQKVCHELNTYIKYNDNGFFQQIVKPFIKNKIIKTFVDLCLLDHDDALKYSEINSFQLLNEFEKVLLVEQLIKKGRKQEAQNIANSMENVNKSERITFERFKKEFDTIITAKLTQQAKGAPTKLVENLKKMEKIKKKMNYRMLQEKKSARSYAVQQQIMLNEAKNQCEYEGQDFDDDDEMYNAREAFVQPFKQMEKTKQYSETTYFGLKYAHQSKDLIGPSPFWTSIAQHFLNSNGDFLSENFMYLAKAVEFTLASCFIPNQKLLEYGLKNQADNVLIEPASSFLVFVREVKSLPFEKKFGVLLNQRFFNPEDRYYYEEDGTRIEKQTEQFIVRRPYCIQTLITNTSGTKLQLQLLIDIPQGSLPLQSHETTQIQSINLQAYSTLSFERFFYFPAVGTYKLYPANACRGGSVIAKAEQIKDIEVLEVETIKKMDTLENVLKSGQKQGILKYLETKNIFDSKIFEPNFILWMLKDKEFYLKVLDILRSRKYYLTEIWMFGYYHNDLTAIKEYEKSQNIQTPENVLNSLPIFEYFPYYSSRAHKFLNQNKSTIRNQQFKKTYFCFLFTSLFNEPSSSKSRVVFIYYLLLQDRIDEAFNLLSSIEEKDKEEHRLQFDYIECFIDMYKGYPTFSRARKIAEKYVGYEVKSWQEMFKEIIDTLKQYDSEEVVEEKKKVQFNTTVVNQGSNLRISVPPETVVEVCLYDINLELYFSSFPFTDVENFSSNVVPNFIQVYEAGEFREQKLMRSKEIKDCFVEVYSSTSGLKKKKVSSFLWSNPDIKIKMKEQNGYAQVFYENKRQAGCYCKVYQMKDGMSKFYRDGYTDITGTFKYALADLEGITEFSILFVTENGGIVQRVKPPSQQAYLQ